MRVLERGRSHDPVVSPEVGPGEFNGPQARLGPSPQGVPWDPGPLTVAGGALRGSQWRAAAAPGQPTTHTSPESRGRHPRMMNETDSEDSDPDTEATEVGGGTSWPSRSAGVARSFTRHTTSPNAHASPTNARISSKQRSHANRRSTRTGPAAGTRICSPTMRGRWWGGKFTLRDAATDASRSASDEEGGDGGVCPKRALLSMDRQTKRPPAVCERPSANANTRGFYSSCVRSLVLRGCYAFWTDSVL